MAPEIDVAQLTISDRTSFLYDKDGKLITSIADVETATGRDIEGHPGYAQERVYRGGGRPVLQALGVDFKRLFSLRLRFSAIRIPPAAAPLRSS